MPVGENEALSIKINEKSFNHLNSKRGEPPLLKSVKKENLSQKEPGGGDSKINLSSRLSLISSGKWTRRSACPHQEVEQRCRESASFKVTCALISGWTFFYLRKQ